jgi:hypothetical protein
MRCCCALLADTLRETRDDVINLTQLSTKKLRADFRAAGILRTGGRIREHEATSWLRRTTRGNLRGLVAFAILVAWLLLGTIQKIRGRRRELPPQRNNVGGEPFHDGFAACAEISSGHTPKTNSG